MAAFDPLGLLAALGLASVHMFAGKLKFLERTPRSAWLSAAGGISVAYVFLYLLPELAAGQRAIQDVEERFFSFIEHHAYAVALIGLTAFYGLERASKSSRQGARRDSGQTPSARVFWAHMALMAFYNVLVGYLLIRDMRDLAALAFFFVAMALHLLVMDRALREHYQDIYHDVGRWVLSAALLAGWGVGTAFEVPEPAMGLFIAFVAGGVILNVLKEELPEQQQSRFGAFLAGTILYAALLLAYG